MITFRHAQRFVLAVAAVFAGCSTPSPRVIATPIHPGMNSAQLLSAFGPPLRTERNPDGSEDWFYNFGTRSWESQPVSEAVVAENEQRYSVGLSTTKVTTMAPLPIHLSPDGRVVGDIPAGRVIVESR
jgi:outer membrane protein assembly factor BamE (lipoprotein component of BamABCDE complex)